MKVIRSTGSPIRRPITEPTGSSMMGNLRALPGFFSLSWKSLNACWGDTVCCPGTSISGKPISMSGNDGRPGRLKLQSISGNRSSRLMLGSQTSGILMVICLVGSISAERMPASEMMLDQPRSVESVWIQANSLPKPIQCTSGHSTVMVGRKPSMVPRSICADALRSMVLILPVLTKPLNALGQSIVVVPPDSHVHSLAPMVHFIAGSLT